ncbi:MAG: hypothetical protein HY594_01035 [Candidatus Omnitrophica bacterium]|nr:hypothetical protein [Candidatus Omnitrophota bacterium]
MARRERSKSGRKSGSPLWQRLQAGLPSLAKTAVFLLALFLVVGVWLSHFVYRSSYFWVSAIEVQLEPGQRWAADPRLGYRIPRPIHVFRADLAALAQAIRREHPQFQKVVVRRNLPNKLVAYVSLRDPIGQIRGRQYTIVSGDGIVLTPGSSTPWEGVPVLMIGSRTAAYQPGQSCDSDEFRRAATVLREVQESKALAGHKISAVRVNPASAGSADSRMVTLLLENGLELRAMPGDLRPRLVRLGELLRGKPKEMGQAQYVDLRFDDLVIGLRSGD